jgi:hypothetical protein
MLQSFLPVHGSAPTAAVRPGCHRAKYHGREAAGTDAAPDGSWKREEHVAMSFEKTPDGSYAERNDEHHSQPRFVGLLALVLMALAVMFALFVAIAAMTHG